VDDLLTLPMSWPMIYVGAPVRDIDYIESEGVIVEGSPKSAWIHVFWRRTGLVANTTAGMVRFDVAQPAALPGLLACVRAEWGDTAHLIRYQTNHQPNGPGTDLVPVVWWAVSVADDNAPMLLKRADGSRFCLAGPTENAALLLALEVARG
jgi:hypothetical protein